MYWQPGFEARLEALEIGLASAEADLQSNYRVESGTGSPLSAVTVGVGAVVLYPLPALSAAPSTWRPEFWTLTSGVIVGSGDLAGVYEAAVTVSFSDNAGAPTVWTWALVRGRDLATSPVVAQRISAPTQLSIIGEPDGVTLHGMIEMPESGSDFEIGLFASHDGGGPIDVTIQAMGLTMERVGSLDQV